MINYDLLDASLAKFKDGAPFHHCFVDGFFKADIAHELEQEFIDYTSEKWLVYDNPIENKKALNDWNAFPKLTYQILNLLNSDIILKRFENILGKKVYADPGLHGGGWHMHGTGGNLNPHLDYSIHPKLHLERKLNIIIYLSSALKEEHGGHLGLWEHDKNKNTLGNLSVEYSPIFNRAIIFDTTQNSWHGLSRPLSQPNGIYRKSLAVYYLCDPDANASTRGRALFAPRENQQGNETIENIIKLRSDVKQSQTVYRTNTL